MAFFTETMGQGMTVCDSYTTVSLLILYHQICRPLQALDISSTFPTDFLLLVTGELLALQSYYRIRV